MKIFKIPVNFLMSQDIKVEADSLDQAIDKAQDIWCALPMDGEYIEDSFDVNYHYAEVMNDENGELKNN